MLKTSPIKGDFGVRIEGVDLSEPLDPDVMKEIIDLFFEHRVMVIPGQSISKKQFHTFCSHFGLPHRHMIRRARLEDFPDMQMLTNKTKDGKEPGRGAVYWHTDECWEQNPASLAHRSRTLPGRIHYKTQHFQTVAKNRLTKTIHFLITFHTLLHRSFVKIVSKHLRGLSLRMCPRWS